jgi:4-hydroxy-tetrahydrodipicolinate synthase
MTTRPARLPLQPASTRLHGVFTAIVTPFTADGALDEPTLRRLLDRQVEAGVAGIVPCGTTGESPTLSEAEHDRVIALAVEAAGRSRGTTRPTILAGTGTNDTDASIRATRRAAELGADAALVVAPYYNRPNQRMLEAHYTAIAEEGGLPVVVYNVPSRTASNVDATTMLRLAAHPNIIGVKEACGTLDQIAVVLRERPSGFAVLAGDDIWTLPMMALGGDGVVSVASNEVPAEMVALCEAAADGRWTDARSLHERLLPLFRANFAGAPNPVPVKAALAMMGLAGETLRRPMLPLDPTSRAELATVLREAGLLSEGPTAGRQRVAVGA